MSKKKLEKAKIIDDFTKYLEEISEKTGRTTDETLRDMLGSSELVVLDETTLGSGTVKLKQIDIWKDVLGHLGVEKESDEQKQYKIYKDLRENFAPVSAGVDFHNLFVASDFEAVIEDSDDKHQKEMKEAIDEFNRKVFQDDYLIGLRDIMENLNDISLTYGCAGAEIIYEHSDDYKFEDFAEVITKTVNGKKQDVVLEVREPNWKKLGGIVRLKIIDDAVKRVKPVRDPVTYEVLYWIIDEGKKSETKLHTWQMFWLPTDMQGTNLFGRSIIKPVVEIAQILRGLYKIIGVNAQKWANRRYFFIMGTEKRPWAKPHIQNFMQDVKEMVEKNKTGIPVPAGFDVKEIGGEIFTADAVLDVLLNQICAGMRYPKEFLEGRQESERRWIAWNVSYGHRQTRIAEAIRHQLWRRHLWCLFGKQHRVPKQGIPVEQQELNPIYVPKLKWKAEGRWAKATELDFMVKLLNVANPVSPELKLALEKRVTNILGLGEIGLPSYEELQKQLEEEEQAQKQKGKKQMGEKVPPDTEKLLKRLQKGVSKTKKETGTESKKGKAKPMGGTRVPKERKVEESQMVSLMDKVLSLLSENKEDRRTKKELMEIQLELEKLKKEEVLRKQEVLDKMKKKLEKIESKGEKK